MVFSPQQYLEQLASLLKVPLGKISNVDSVYSRVIGNKTVTGIINIILSLLIESKSNLWGTDSLEKAEIQQWLEYGIVHVVHADEPQNLRQILSVSKSVINNLFIINYLTANRAIEVIQNVMTRDFLTDLNDMLATKTYLVSYKLTIADVMLYYILINSMVAMSYLDKQKYLNVSRWFDNLQQDTFIRQNNKLVDFSTNYLTSFVSSKH